MIGYKTSDQQACDHAGLWQLDTVAGYGIQSCAGCGRSYCIWKLPDGTIVWMPMARLSEDESKEVVERERGAELANLDEEVQLVPEGAADDELQPECADGGWDGLLLPGVPDTDDTRGDGEAAEVSER